MSGFKRNAHAFRYTEVVADGGECCRACRSTDFQSASKSRRAACAFFRAVTIGSSWGLVELPLPGALLCYGLGGIETPQLTASALEKFAR
jgi:hypothetical protein